MESKFNLPLRLFEMISRIFLLQGDLGFNLLARLLRHPLLREGRLAVDGVVGVLDTPAAVQVHQDGVRVAVQYLGGAFVPVADHQHPVCGDDVDAVDTARHAVLVTYASSTHSYQHFALLQQFRFVFRERHAVSGVVYEC